MTASITFPSALDQSLLAHNKLTQFESWWDLDLDWYEPPNHRRNGWSGISRFSLQDSHNKPVPVFVKRQLNHCYRALNQPHRKRPTLFREFKAIQQFQKLGIGTVTPVFYGEDKTRAILITHALEEFISLDVWHTEHHSSNHTWSDTEVISAIAKQLYKLHSHRIQHGCLYAKHIFIGSNPPQPNPDSKTSCPAIKLIDLEKTRCRFSTSKAAVHDLNQLFRHSPAWFAQSHDLFFDTYSQNPADKIWPKLCSRWNRGAVSRRPKNIPI